MSMAIQILERHAGRSLAPGETIVLEPDLIGIHDILGHTIVDILDAVGVETLPHPDRLAVFLDHAAPPPSPLYAAIHRQLRRFASRVGALYLGDVGEGIMHQLIVEKGLAKPWDFVIASDSHTTTIGAIGAFSTGMGSTDIAYALATGETWLKVPEPVRIVLEGDKLDFPLSSKDIALRLLGDLGSSWANYKAVEFQGSLVDKLTLSSRMTLSNMSVEMGAKTGLFPVDDVTRGHFEALGLNVKTLRPLKDAVYVDEYTLDVNSERLEPMVAKPYTVSNVAPVSEVEGLEVDMVFIGSCTNGREEDFHSAARIIRGKRINKATRCIAIPASRRIYMNLLADGTLEILAKAGCVVSFGTCGPCWGGHMGVAGEDEVVVSTSNRNFKGRMGHRTARIYLASPATAAAAAVTGRITDPRSLIG